MTENTTKQGLSRIWLLVGGIVVMMFLGLIYAWSIFLTPLSELFPTWTVTQTTVVFTLSIVFFCIGGFIAGRLASKIPHRFILFTAAALCLIGFTMIFLLLDKGDSAKSLLVLYIFYGIFCGLAVGFSYNTILGVVVKQFQGNAGVASGFLLLGFGVGGMLFAGIVKVLVASYDLNRTFLILGILLTVILLLAGFALKPPAKSLSEKNSNGNKIESEDKRTLKDVITTPTFWVFFLWGVCINICGLLVISRAAKIAESFEMIVIMGMIVTVFNGIGRPAVGLFFDKFGRNKTMILVSLLVIISGLLLLFGDLAKNQILIYIGLPLIGVAYGGSPTISSGVVNKFYGAKFFQVVFAILTFGLAVSALIGPPLSARLQEQSNGGYTTSFIMLIIIGVIAVVLNVLMGYFAKKDKLE